MSNEAKLPLIPLAVGIAVLSVFFMAGSASQKKRVMADQEFQRASSAETTARSHAEQVSRTLSQRNARMAQVDQFLSQWKSVYLQGLTTVRRPGQFTQYLEHITQGTRVVRQAVEPAKDDDKAYLVSDGITVPARSTKVEFVGPFDEILRVIGTFEQENELAAMQKAEFRISDKHLTCIYTFAYPSLLVSDATAQPSAN
jgi:hypothetical protein